LASSACVFGLRSVSATILSGRPAAIVGIGAPPIPRSSEPPVSASYIGAGESTFWNWTLTLFALNSSSSSFWRCITQIATYGGWNPSRNSGGVGPATTAGAVVAGFASAAGLAVSAGLVAAGWAAGPAGAGGG